MKTINKNRLRLVALGLVTGALACALTAGCTTTNNNDTSAQKDQAPVEQKDDATQTTADNKAADAEDAGTSADEAQTTKSAVAGTETRPSLMPASHEGRSSQMCYACHGASEKGNPALATATAMPDGHYVNNDPNGFELDPVRNQCFTCHSIDPQKEESAK